MVGVPGRSKGCNTCIQRKIRCDQETPLCGNCRKSNRLCTGYKRRLGYVLSRDVSLADLAGPSRDETAVIYQGRWRRTKPQQPPHATYRVAESPPTWADMPSSVSLGRHVSANTALRQQFHYIVLNDHLPAEILDKSRPKSVVPTDWLLQLQDVVIQSPALETSIAAFFAARVGRKKNDMNLVYYSRSMYGDGLERFQRALRNPQTRLSDETLAACIALLLYELTEHSVGTPSAYITHQRGAMMLLQLRGPDASASPLGHSLFVQLRAQSILGSLLDRREIFLSHPEWAERPWKLVPKTHLDELYDSLFEISAIFQKVDEISKQTNQSVLQDGFRDIITMLLKVESALRGSYGNFKKSISGPLYWPELSTLQSHLDDTELGKVFPVSFHFPAFVVAEVTTTYWSGMMAVHEELMRIYDELAAMKSSTALASVTGSPLRPTAACNSLSSAVPSDPRSREHGNKSTTMARNICQSTEYFLQGKMGELGSITMLMLLSGCKSCFENATEDWSREISWITDFMGRIKKKVNLPRNDLLED